MHAWSVFFFLPAEDVIRDAQRSRGVGVVYRRRRRLCSWPCSGKAELPDGKRGTGPIAAEGDCGAGLAPAKLLGAEEAEKPQLPDGRRGTGPTEAEGDWQAGLTQYETYNDIG